MNIVLFPRKEIIKTMGKQLNEIFNASKQAIYLFLDDNHKICNQLFAELLGYESADEFAAVKDSFTEVFVSPESRDTLSLKFSESHRR